MYTQKQLRANFTINPVEHIPANGYPANHDLFIECLNCGDLTPTLPNENIGCKCLNVFIDVESGRVSIKQEKKIRLVRLEPRH